MDWREIQDRTIEWYTEAVALAWVNRDSEERKKADTDSLLTEHEKLVAFLRSHDFNMPTSLEYMSRLFQNDPTFIDNELCQKFVRQWDAYVAHLHRENVQALADRKSEDPDFFTKFCGRITFENAFSNELWRRCAGRSTIDMSAVLYPILSNKRKALAVFRAKRPREDKSAERRQCPDEYVVKLCGFVEAMMRCAMAAAKRESLDSAISRNLKPAVDKAVLALNQTAGELSTNFVRDNTTPPNWQGELKRLVSETKDQWQNTFGNVEEEYPDVKEREEQVREAYAQIEKDAKQTETHNTSQLLSEPKTLKYLSDYLTYLVGESISVNTVAVAAVCGQVEHELKEAGADSEFLTRVLSSDRVDMDWIKRLRTEYKGEKERPVNDPERRDARSVLSWVASLVAEVRERERKLQDIRPTESKFKEARAAAYSYAAMIDYARWVLAVRAHTNANTTILDAMNVVPVGTTYIEALQQKEADVRARAKVELEEQAQTVSNILKPIHVRLSEMLKWYADLAASMQSRREGLESELLLFPKKWNDLTPYQESIGAIRHLYADLLKDVKDPQIMKISDRLLEDAARVHRMSRPDYKFYEVDVVSFKELQRDMQSYLVGLATLWLTDG